MHSGISIFTKDAYNATLEFGKVSYTKILHCLIQFVSYSFCNCNFLAITFFSDGVMIKMPAF